MRATGILGPLLAVVLAAAPASAEEWHSQQPVAPGIGVPVELGEVGDVEFWAPNRGLLITAGNGGVQAGLFAYDGSDWYRYSTVCGGQQGRIAWAGPNEFWTISDKQAGQETNNAPYQHLSLCHFKDGAVVASYAKPHGVPGSYLPMSAAACSGPSECWFGGERLPGTANEGAFHLRWDGNSLTAVPSLTDVEPEVADPGRSVTSLAYFGGDLYEGVRAQPDDVAPEESPTQPSLLHMISPASANPFVPLLPESDLIFGGPGATAEQLEGFQLSAAGESLWAISGAFNPPAALTVLRKQGSGPFAQVTLADAEGVLDPGDSLGGAAPEPGQDYAWVGFQHPPDATGMPPARLTRVHADGTVDPEVSLPDGGEGIGRKGRAGPIACPAAGQCWMATDRGWLFHLGPDPAPNTDPAMHALITYRPPDESLPSVPPISLPEDSSGALSPYEYQGTGEEPEKERRRPGRRPRKLLVGVDQHLVHGRVLVLSFTLRAKAHVRLVAMRSHRVVARTRRYTMGKGRRQLRLRLDPKRWPTKLDLQVHAVKTRKGKAG
jgi:hypothetical protein